MLKLGSDPIEEIRVELDLEEINLVTYLDTMENSLIKLKENFDNNGKLDINLCNSLGISYDFDSYDSIIRILEITLPQILRRSFVISVWSFFEKNVNVIAGLQGHKSSFTIREIKGSILERIKLYFNRVFGITFKEKNDVWEYITKFKLIRDAIAHNNGYISKMDPNNELIKYITENSKQLEIDNAYIVIKNTKNIEDSYLVQSIMKILVFLNFLIDRITTIKKIKSPSKEDS